MNADQHSNAESVEKMNLLSEQKKTDDLTALTNQLVRALRKAAPDHDLPAKALDYLKRHGRTSALRAEAKQ